MKKRISLIFLLFICLYPVRSQNLVPNGSMEIKKECPGTSGGIDLATGWFSTLNSPDYYHACNTDRYKTLDSNLAGFQLPFHGDAYCALVTKNSGSDYHEHQGIQLISPLVKGTVYNCRMWVSLCELSSYASNKLGFQFNMSDKSSINNISQVYTDLVITDKKNWVLVSGNFVATSAYTHVFIGNFFTDANTQLKNVSGGSYEGAYYYIDSISVAPVGTLEGVDILPTSVAGKYTVIGVKENSSLVVTLASGEEIYSTHSAIPHMEIDLSRFGHGTYCIIAESSTGDQVRKIIVY